MIGYDIYSAEFANKPKEGNKVNGAYNNQEKSVPHHTQSQVIFSNYVIIIDLNLNEVFVHWERLTYSVVILVIRSIDLQFIEVHIFGLLRISI